MEKTLKQVKASGYQSSLIVLKPHEATATYTTEMNHEPTCEYVCGLLSIKLDLMNNEANKILPDPHEQDSELNYL